MSTLERLLYDVPHMTLEDARAFLKHIARDPQFLTTQILPHMSAKVASREPIIVATYGAREASTCLQVFVWPAGAATPIHDHTAWGAYMCIVGALMEDRYACVDREHASAMAHLRKQWRRVWDASHGASTVGAYEAGIHKVANPGGALSISVHMYGPRNGPLDGRDYDPRRNYVCDRVEADVPLQDAMGPIGAAAPGAPRLLPVQ
jgi:predicted metal-dependent enzyme (double-stranded beta helix superfamily)